MSELSSDYSDYKVQSYQYTLHTHRQTLQIWCQCLYQAFTIRTTSTQKSGRCSYITCAHKFYHTCIN